jgi:hypothetical protein
MVTADTTLSFVMFDYNYSDYFPKENLSIGVCCVRDLRFFRQCNEDHCLQGFQFWCKQSCPYGQHARKCIFRLFLTLGADVGDV